MEKELLEINNSTGEILLSVLILLRAINITTGYSTIHAIL